jgi:hypothetical protein
MDPWRIVEVMVVELLYQDQSGINDTVSHTRVVA